MTYAADSFDTLPRLPAWVTARRAETPEDVSFLSGAALNHLHLVLSDEDVPQTLLRQRLALRAAEACVAQQGRPDQVVELRDVIHLLRPGDLPGPAEEIYLQWRRAVARPVSIKALCPALPGFDPDKIASWLDAGKGAPITGAAAVLEAVLTDTPYAEVLALVLADAALSQALDWDHLMPLLAVGLKRADLLKRGEGLRLACYRTVTVSTLKAVRMGLLR